MRPVTVVMLGTPVAFARTRPNPTGALFTPRKQRNAAAVFRLLAQNEMIGRRPFDEPVTIEFVAEVEVPGSWSRKKKAAALAGELRPKGRPDLSNYLKLVEDAANGIVWRDDALIVECRMRKIYSDQAKVTLVASPALESVSV